jgi:hypothetical protein
MLHKPFVTKGLEKMLNPIMGKSVVMYFTAVKKKGSIT